VSRVLRYNRRNDFDRFLLTWRQPQNDFFTRDGIVWQRPTNSLRGCELFTGQLGILCEWQEGSLLIPHLCCNDYVTRSRARARAASLFVYFDGEWTDEWRFPGLPRLIPEWAWSDRQGSKRGVIDKQPRWKSTRKSTKAFGIRSTRRAAAQRVAERKCSGKTNPRFRNLSREARVFVFLQFTMRSAIWHA